MGCRRGQLLRNRSSVAAKGREYKPSAPGILDSSDEDEFMDPARCSRIQMKAFANESFVPNHHLVHRATWLHDALRQKDFAKDSLGDVALQHLDAFGLRAPYKKQFQENVCKDGGEGIQALSKTELLDNYISQVCKKSGFPLWGN